MFRFRWKKLNAREIRSVRRQINKGNANEDENEEPDETRSVSARSTIHHHHSRCMDHDKTADVPPLRQCTARRVRTAAPLVPFPSAATSAPARTNLALLEARQFQWKFYRKFRSCFIYAQIGKCTLVKENCEFNFLGKKTGTQFWYKVDKLL